MRRVDTVEATAPWGIAGQFLKKAGYGWLLPGDAMPKTAAPRTDASGIMRQLIRTTGNGANRMGYGSYGASRKKVGLEEWRALSGTPDEDIICNLPLLRARSRDLFMGSPLAAAAILTLRRNVVGNGLRPMPQIDGATLGKSNDECAEMNKLISDEFGLFANSVECDFSRRSTFYQLQDIVFVNSQISGDVLVLLPMTERLGAIYDTRIRLIEADRVSSAFNVSKLGDDVTRSGVPRIFGGVELSDDGEVLAYWVSKTHPLSAENIAIGAGALSDIRDYDRVEAFGSETGRPVALLVGEMERPEQRRAVPLLAKCLIELKNLSRYIESTTVRNVIQSYFTAFVTSQMPSTEMFANTVSDEDVMNREPYKVQLGPGIVNWMRPGDKIEFPINAGPESEFDPYVTALCKFIGAALGIPYEVLLKQFNASYSASRASLLQFWNCVKVARQLLVDQFCQPVYVAWMMEAIGKGVIDAPEFDNPRIQRAWTRCSWSGAGLGSIDPLKEAQAAIQRLKAGLSTLERESLEINGSDWRANTTQQGLERDLADEFDLPYIRAAAPPSPFGGGGNPGPSKEKEGEEEEKED
jgi:lambda family phage portal protein